MRRVLAVGLCAWAACVDQGPGPQGKKIEASYVAQHVLRQLPAGAIARLDVSLGGKVTYVGNTVDKPTIAPGETVRVTHYWRVDQPVGVGWRVFAPPLLPPVGGGGGAVPAFWAFAASAKDKIKTAKMAAPRVRMSPPVLR